MVARAIHPLTLVKDGRRDFGECLAEIILSEGFPYLETTEVPQSLVLEADSHPVVLYALRRLQRDATQRAIELAKNGSLVLFTRPEGEVADHLDLEEATTVTDPYIEWKGSRSLQIHGPATIYDNLGGWRQLALLMDGGEGELGPGIMARAHGQGTVIVTAFNLAESIVFTRQGNPEWRNDKGDEWLGGLRPGDLFYRKTGERWIDSTKTDVPQADLLQRFLVDQIILHAPIPLPRVWYFPNMEKVSFTVVADSDGATPLEVRAQADLIESHGGVFSLYLIDKTLDLMDVADAEELVGRGNEVSIHPDYGRVGDTLGPRAQLMRKLYREMVERFEDKFGFRPMTVRHHSLVWCDWVEVPKIQEEFGVKLDNCYGYPCWFGQKEYGGSEVGYLTGSGQPQRFADLDGRLVGVYQLEQQLEDEILVPEKGLALSGQEADQRLREFISASREGNYSHIVACFHPITLYNSPEAYRALDGVLSFCMTNQVPIRTLADISRYADLRRRVEFSAFTREPGQISFEISGPAEAASRGLTVVVPSLRVDGIASPHLSWAEQELGGRGYLAAVLDRLPAHVSIQTSRLG
jgi:hypothetical protein